MSDSPKEHEKAWCPLCETWMFKCRTCGNNTCNGGYGTINGTISGAPDEEKCTDCESAYELFDKLQAELQAELDKAEGPAA